MAKKACITSMQLLVLCIDSVKLEVYFQSYYRMAGYVPTTSCCASMKRPWQTCPTARLWKRSASPCHMKNPRDPLYLLSSHVASTRKPPTRPNNKSSSSMADRNVDSGLMSPLPQDEENGECVRHAQ